MFAIMRFIYLFILRFQIVIFHSAAQTNSYNPYRSVIKYYLTCFADIFGGASKKRVSEIYMRTLTRVKTQVQPKIKILSSFTQCCNDSKHVGLYFFHVKQREMFGIHSYYSLSLHIFHVCQSRHCALQLLLWKKGSHAGLQQNEGE